MSRSRNLVQFFALRIVENLPTSGNPGSRFRPKTAQDMSGLSGFPARFERFERFGRFFLEKPLKPLKSCLKNRSKTAHFLWWFLNGFSSQIWAVFKRFLSGLRKKIPIKTIKRPVKGTVTLRSSWSTIYNLKNVLNRFQLKQDTFHWPFEKCGGPLYSGVFYNFPFVFVPRIIRYHKNFCWINRSKTAQTAHFEARFWA